MESSYLYLLPVVVFFWFSCTFILTFTIAVLMGHVDPIFPYISDTATFIPESCVFGQLINIGTILYGCVIYVRWAQCNQICIMHDLENRTRRLSTAAAWVGCVSCLGINFVGNFQTTAVFTIHVVAATLGFGCGTAWLIMQTIISYKLYPLATPFRWLLHLRTFITFIAVIAFIICMLCGALAFHLFNGKTGPDMVKWSKKDGGWEYHLASSVSEWTNAMLAILFVLTLTEDFRRVQLSAPNVFVDTDALFSDVEARETLRRCT